MEDEILTTDEVAKLTKTPASRWHKLRMGSDGPPYIKMGHLVRYRKADVMSWLFENRVW